MRPKLRLGRTAPFTAARGIVLVALGAGWPWVLGRAAEEAQPVTPAAVLTPANGTAEKDKKNALPPKPVFAPEVEKKLADLMAKIADAKRRFWLKRMGKIIDKLVKVTDLDEQARAALEASSREVVERCLPEWQDACDRMIRGEIKQFPDNILASFEATSEDALPFAFEFGKTTLPQDHVAWTEAVQRTLSTEQWALWQKSVAADQQALHAEIDDHVSAWLEPRRERLLESILSKCAEMGRTLNLPEERLEELKALAAKAVDESVGKMRITEEKVLAAMDDEARRKMLQNRNIYLSLESEDSPENLSDWTTGLAGLLSADERKRLEADASEHQARRAHALARLFLAEFDRKVALTASQRQRLEPVAERLAADRAKTFSERSENDFQWEVRGALTDGIKSASAEIQAIVEPIQWKHWLDACDMAAEDQRARVIRPASLPEPGEKASILPEAEEYEHAFSDYLDELTRKMRQRTLAELLLRAEDAGRAASLPADKVERLKTAARGAVEESLDKWKSNVSQQARSFAGDASGRMIRLRLKGLGESNFLRRFDPPPETQALWVTALKTELDAAQTAAAEESAKEREVFRDTAVARFVVSMFDKFQPITAEQQGKIEPAVAAMFKEYQVDICQCFSFDYAEWYLTNYTMFLPIAAVPEAELKSILGPERFEQWTRSQQFASAMSYWPMIKQNHDNRVKSEKK